CCIAVVLRRDQPRRLRQRAMPMSPRPAPSSSVAVGSGTLGAAPMFTVRLLGSTSEVPFGITRLTVPTISKFPPGTAGRAPEVMVSLNGDGLGVAVNG